MTNWRLFAGGISGWRGRCGVLVLAWLLSGGVATAQTTSATLQWSHADSLINVQGYTFSLKIDAAAPTALTATCVAGTSVVNCTAPITTNLAVTHTIVVTAMNAAGSAAGTLNYVPPATPAPLSSVKIVITITVP